MHAFFGTPGIESHNFFLSYNVYTHTHSIAQVGTVVGVMFIYKKNSIGLGHAHLQFQGQK